MLLLLVVGALIYLNARLALKKGRNPYIWGFVSFIAFFVAYGILGYFYLSSIYSGPFTRESVETYLMNEPLSLMMMVMLGIGGMLLVRFILERLAPQQNGAGPEKEG